MKIQVIDIKRIDYAVVSDEGGVLVAEVWLAGNPEAFTFKGDVAQALVSAVRGTDLDNDVREKIMVYVRDV